MPNPVHLGPETGWDDMPTPEQVEQWSKDNSEVAEVKSTDEGHPKEESQKEVEPQPELEAQTEEKSEKSSKDGEKQKEAKPSEEGKPKSKFQLAKEAEAARVKEQEHKLNEAWKRNREFEQQLTRKAEELEKREKGLEYTPEQWLKQAEYLEEKGLYEDAQAARQMADQVRQHQANTQQQQLSAQEFERQWKTAEQDIAAQDPLFFTKDSWVEQGMKEVLNDPEIGKFFWQHPMGAWAAYYCVQTRYAQKVIPPLVKYCQELETKVQKYEKHNSPLSSAPHAASMDAARKFSEMNDAQMEASLEKSLGNL